MVSDPSDVLMILVLTELVFKIWLLKEKITRNADDLWEAGKYYPKTLINFC